MTIEEGRDRQALRVGVIGYGAIGQVLVSELVSGSRGLELVGVLGRGKGPAPGWSTLEELVSGCDVVVEAAGQDAVREYGPAVLEAGCDLFVLSVGAFADSALLQDLQARGGGRLLLSTGAIGGVDLLRAAALSGRLDSVKITTTKPASTLLGNRGRLDRTDSGEETPSVVFSGTAREVASRYPSSTNVAATVGLATLGMDLVHVDLVADPATSVVTHRLQASGRIGTYDFTIRNAPSDNPRTSLITPYAVLRALGDLRSGVVIL